MSSGVYASLCVCTRARLCVCVCVFARLFVCVCSFYDILCMRSRSYTVLQLDPVGYFHANDSDAEADFCVPGT